MSVADDPKYNNVALESRVYATDHMNTNFNVAGAAINGSEKPWISNGPQFTKFTMEWPYLVTVNEIQIVWEYPP